MMNPDVKTSVNRLLSNLKCMKNATTMMNLRSARSSMTVTKKAPKKASIVKKYTSRSVRTASHTPTMV